MKTALITHEDCLAHGYMPDHGEVKERLSSVLRVFSDMEPIKAPYAAREDLLRAHTDDHIANMLQTIPDGETLALDFDTALDSFTSSAALRSAGAGIAALDGVMNGDFDAPFCAIRPPGHHAEPARAMGFCYFSNIAITALRAKYVYGIERIAIVDFDVHHGNGTQACLEQEDGLYFGSIHQHPHYPNTGVEITHKTACIIRNIPLPSGTSTANWRAVFENKIITDLHDFKPELILVSAGFDAYKGDPYGEFNLLAEDFSWLGEQLGGLAKTYANSRIVSMMEGGYDIGNLAKAARAYMDALKAL